MSEAKKDESELKSLLCGCGVEFTRPASYLAQKRTDPLFKWTCTKCDICKENRVKQALNRLPEVINALNT